MQILQLQTHRHFALEVFFLFQGYLDIQQDKVEPLTLVNNFLWLAKHNNLSIRVIC